MLVIPPYLDGRCWHRLAKNPAQKCGIHSQSAQLLHWYSAEVLWAQSCFHNTDLKTKHAGGSFQNVDQYKEFVYVFFLLKGQIYQTTHTQESSSLPTEILLCPETERQKLMVNFIIQTNQGRDSGQLWIGNRLELVNLIMNNLKTQVFIFVRTLLTKIKYIRGLPWQSSG